MLGRARMILWLMVALAGLGALALYVTAKRENASPLIAARADSAPLGGPFTLTAADGSRFASSRLAGKPYALFFGFTHCPDVCPTTLARLAKLRKQLSGGEAGLQLVFVSVDPARDTPAVMKPYGAMFNTPLVALTGSQAEIDAVAKAYGIYVRKVAQADGDYSVDHSSAVMLFDRAGAFVATIAPDESDAVALAKLKRIAG